MVVKQVDNLRSGNRMINLMQSPSAWRYTGKIAAGRVVAVVNEAVWHVFLALRPIWLDECPRTSLRMRGDPGDPANLCITGRW